MDLWTVTKWCTEKHSKNTRVFFSRRYVHCQYVFAVAQDACCPNPPKISRAVVVGQVRLQVHLEHIFKMSFILFFFLYFLNTAWSPQVTQRFYGGRNWERERVSVYLSARSLCVGHLRCEKKKTWRLAWDTVFIIAVCTNDKIWNIPGCEVELFLMHNSILNSATKAGWHIVDFNWIKLLVPDFETSAQAYFTSLLVYIFMFCLCNLSTLLVYVFVCMLNKKKKKKVDSFSIRSALCQWNAGLHSIMDILYTAKHCPCIL